MGEGKWWKERRASRSRRQSSRDLACLSVEALTYYAQPIFEQEKTDTVLVYFNVYVYIRTYEYEYKIDR